MEESRTPTTNEIAIAILDVVYEGMDISPDKYYLDMLHVEEQLKIYSEGAIKNSLCYNIPRNKEHG